MKVYSIGREMGCDIVINDSTNVISRRHAILNVMPSGKMTIIDQSHNGTYVNGIRITPNVPVPVTRKDSISLAHVAQLNWDMIPKTMSPLRYAIFGVIGAVVIAGGIIGYNSLNQKEYTTNTVPDSTMLKKDSTQNKAQEPAKDNTLIKKDTGKQQKETSNKSNDKKVEKTKTTKPKTTTNDKTKTKEAAPSAEPTKKFR